MAKKATTTKKPMGRPARVPKRSLAVPDGLRCLEASPQSRSHYIPCMKPADFVVKHNREAKSIPMCGVCADHNVKNRGAKLIYADEKFDLVSLADFRGQMGPAASDEKPSAPKSSVAPVESKEITDFTMYVGQGMERFRQRLGSMIDLVVNPERAASEQAALYIMMRDAKDQVETAYKMLSDACTKMSEETIPAAFEREDIKSFTTRDGHRVTLSTKYMASIIKDRKDDAYKWLREHKLGDLIIETVMASTLSAAAKVEMEQGRELPEELFSAHFKTTTSLTKAKSK